MKSEKGFSLVEVLVALALLGIIGAAFLGSLATASKCILIADERTTAESLARSQMEYVKNQVYIDYSEDPHDVYNTIDTPTGSSYSISFSIVPFDPNTGVPYTPDEEGIFDGDDGIQKITVFIYHPYDPIHPDENIVITLEDYKVYR